MSRTIHDAVLRSGEAGRTAADVLHGTWLGHPLHPVLTDFVIGAWTIGAGFDVAGEAADDPRARWAGDALAAIGTALAVPAALSGLADYSTLPRPASRDGTLHGALNAVNAALYLVSVRLRATGRRRAGLLFSGLGFASSMLSAWLGGRLVYRHRVGVDHREDFSGPEEWTAVLDAADLREGEPTRAEVDGKSVLLCRDGDEVRAIGCVCSHAGGPLDEGRVAGERVRCPWHDSVFDLRDGKVVHGPATLDQSLFEARIRDGRVEVKLVRA